MWLTDMSPRWEYNIHKWRPANSADLHILCHYESASKTTILMLKWGRKNSQNLNDVIKECHLTWCPTVAEALTRGPPRLQSTSASRVRVSCLYSVLITPLLAPVWGEKDESKVTFKPLRILSWKVKINLVKNSSFCKMTWKWFAFKTRQLWIWMKKVQFTESNWRILGITSSIYSRFSCRCRLVYAWLFPNNN